jgi:hypothetical protein
MNFAIIVWKIEKLAQEARIFCLLHEYENLNTKQKNETELSAIKLLFVFHFPKRGRKITRFLRKTFSR